MALKEKPKTFVSENVIRNGLKQIVSGATIYGVDHRRSSGISWHCNHRNGPSLCRSCFSIVNPSMTGISRPRRIPLADSVRSTSSPSCPFEVVSISNPSFSSLSRRNKTTVFWSSTIRICLPMNLPVWFYVTLLGDVGFKPIFHLIDSVS